MNMKLFAIVVIGLFLLSGCAQEVAKEQKTLENSDKVKTETDQDSVEKIAKEPELEAKDEIEKESPTDGKVDIIEKTPFELRNPVSKFTDDDVDKLGLSCSGSQPEIAECIYEWQRANMIYVQTAEESQGPFNQPYPIRWQDILPGIYSSKDVIETQKTSSGELYGICFGFATVYCSIAEYYGLDCRVMETKLNLNGEDRPGGMSPDEYDVLSEYLSKNNLDYPYDAVRLSMPDDSGIAGHYWAEVKLSEASDYDNDGWRIMDASNKKYDGRSMTKKHILKGEFNVVDWKSKDKTTILKGYAERIAAGEDLGRQNEEGKSDMDTFTEGRQIYEDDVAAGREEAYVGMTDELGNKNRAKTVDDYMQGKALAPYFSSCRDACDFILGGDACKDDCEDLDETLAVCYKKCSGDEFFIACDYICEDEEGASWAACYESCSGNKLDLSCDDKCAD